MHIAFRTSRLPPLLCALVLLSFVPIPLAQAAPAPLPQRTAVEGKVSVPFDVVEYSFPVTGGEHFTFDVQAATWSGSGKAALRLHDPDGDLQATVDVSAGATFTDVTAPEDESGDWTAVLDPDEANVGSTTFVLAKDVDYGRLISGVSEGAKISYRGQRAVYAFVVTAGEHFSVGVKAAAWAGGSAALNLLNPAGILRAEVDISTRDSFTEVTAGKGEAGVWSVVVDPVDDVVGAATFTYAKDVAAGTLKNAVPASSAIVQRGQRAVHTFKVTGGEHLTLDVRSVTWSGTHRAGLRLYTPARKLRARMDISSRPGFLEIKARKGEAGTWSVVLDPDGANLGSVELVLARDVKAGTVKRGTYKTTRIDYRGQQAVLGFVVPSTRAVTIDVLKATWSGSRSAWLNVYDGDGHFHSRVNVSRALTRTRLDVAAGTSGRWRAVLDPDGATTGSIAFTVR